MSGLGGKPDVARTWPGRPGIAISGSQRVTPLSILCLEDKIVQQAVVFVLEAIYEVGFLGFSYGFRPLPNRFTIIDSEIPTLGNPQNESHLLQLGINGY